MSFIAVVNRSLSFGELIGKGKYGKFSVDCSLEGRFFKSINREGCGEVCFELVERCGSFEDTWSEMWRRGLRPADPVELLAFAAAFPEEQKKHPIVEIGSHSYFCSYRHVMYLSHFSNGTAVSILDWGESLGGNERFLAVRE